MFFKRKRFLGIVFVILTFVYVFIRYDYSTEFSYDVSNKFTMNVLTKFSSEIEKTKLRTDPNDVLKTFSIDEKEKSKLKILIYTPQFGDLPWYKVPNGYKFTENNGDNCFENRCQLSYAKEEINSADVVIFHGFMGDLPSLKELWKLKRSNYKSKWIWYFLESPWHQKEVTKDYDGLFDMTASYNTKSDIHIPYYTYVKLQSVENSTKIKQLKKHDSAKDKDKMVLFINSNCDFRLDIVKKLKEYVSVDVYGRCKGNIKQNLEIPDCKRNTKECDRLQARYKFYLAIENSFCEDYVTEKYYEQSLLKGLVPIMMGPINFNDNRLIIPNSFIDMKKFKDIKELANYLKYLDSNDTAYNEYFAWRQHYRYVDANVMCKFCQALWSTEVKVKKITKISEFFNYKTKCFNPNEYLSQYI